MIRLHSGKLTNRGMMMSKRMLLGLLLLCVSTGVALADTIKLKSDHPDRYVVAKGDTLWDISARFLESPWRWPEVWSFNPQIKNPHLIYPGDVVFIEYDAQGRPILRVQRGKPTMKLSPKVRAERIDTPIATIPLDAISQFLGQPRVLSEREVKDAAYIVSGKDQRLISGEDDIIYARGLVPGQDPKSRYVVLRIGKPYRNKGAASGDILGYEALHVGDAIVEEFGDPSTLKIMNSSRETLVGYKLVPKGTDGVDQAFLPHPPELPIEGNIIAVVDGLSRIGQFQTVVLNQGEQDGLEVGHVLAVYQAGAVIRDPFAKNYGEKVQLPDVRAGIVLVFRTFERVSFALVMDSEKDMRVYDSVRNP